MGLIRNCVRIDDVKDLNDRKNEKREASYKDFRVVLGV